MIFQKILLNHEKHEAHEKGLLSFVPFVCFVVALLCWWCGGDGRSVQRRAEFFLSDGRRLALEEIAEQRRHLAGFLIPLFARTQGFIIVFRKQNMHFAFC